QAWRQGQRPRIDDFLPTGVPLRARVLIELVHIDLELRLKAGEAARVEEYLDRHPELASDRNIVLEFIAAEHSLRRQREPDLALEEYLRRFPHHGTELAEQIARATINLRAAPPRPTDQLAEALPEVPGFEVRGVLGRGGMGVVYRARQLAL